MPIVRRPRGHDLRRSLLKRSGEQARPEAYDFSRLERRHPDRTNASRRSPCVRRAFVVALIFSTGVLSLVATPGDSRPQAPPGARPALPSEGSIAALKRRIDSEMPALVAAWIELASIPAPSGHEEARAAYVERSFREIGLEEVR